MDIAQVIAQNLSTLMAADPERDTLMKVSKAAGVGFGTVRRAKTGDGNLTVANLELLVHAFRRSARDLLMEDCGGYPAAPGLPSIGIAERGYLSATFPNDPDIASVVDLMRKLEPRWERARRGLHAGPRRWRPVPPTSKRCPVIDLARYRSVRML